MALVFLLWCAGLGAAAQFGKISILYEDLRAAYGGQGEVALGLVVSIVGMVGLVFGTTADGASSPTERMRIDSAGKVTGSASYVAHSATAIPAGGTAGAGLMVSSTANFGIFFGSGAPTLSAAKGSLYLRSDGSTTNDRMYVNTTGAALWAAVTTAS